MYLYTSKSITMRRIIIISVIGILTILHTSAQSFFEEINIPDTAHIECLAVNPSGDIFIGIRPFQNYKGDILRKMQSDSTWFSLYPEQLPSFAPISMDISDSGIIYVGTCSSPNYLLKSIDNGDTWEVVQIPGTNNVVAIEAIGEDSIIVGRNPAEPIVVHSIDNGQNWDYDTVTKTTNNFIQDFEVTKNGEVYACMNCITIDHGGIYKSTDFCKTWEFDGLIDHQVFSLALNSTGDLFTGDLYVCGSSQPGVYCKKKDSTNYQHILWASGVEDMVVANEDCLYVCSDFWIYRTPDYGQTIDTIFDQLGLSMEHMCIDPLGYLWCAHPSLLIKSKEPVNGNGVGINDIDKKNKNHISVFPNPVRNRVNIQFGAGESKEIVVYGANGVIQSHYDDYHGNKLHLDTSGYLPGIYFVSVKDSNNNRYLSKFLKL